MAEDYRHAFMNKTPSKTFTASTNATQIMIPPATQVITVGSKDKALYLGFGERVDGDPMAAADSIYIAQDAYFSMRLQHGLDCFFVAVSGTGTGTATIVLEQN